MNDPKHPEIAFEEYMISCLPDESMAETISDRMQFYARDYMQTAIECMISGSAQIMEADFDGEFGQEYGVCVRIESMVTEDDEEPFIAHVRTAFTEELIFHTYHRGRTPVDAVAWAIASAYVDRIAYTTPAG
jgi:hypothetical protein